MERIDVDRGVADARVRHDVEGAGVGRPVGAQAHREDFAVHLVVGLHARDRALDVVVEPEVGEVRTDVEARVAHVLARVERDAVEVRVGRELREGAFAVGVGLPDRDRRTQLRAAGEGRVEPEHAAVDVGAVALVAVELLRFVRGVEDVGPDAHAFALNIAVHDDAGDFRGGVVGDVVGARDDRGGHEFGRGLDARIGELARGRIDEGRGFQRRVADGGEHFAGERVAFAVHDPLRGGVEGGVGRDVVCGSGRDRPNLALALRYLLKIPGNRFVPGG